MRRPTLTALVVLVGLVLITDLLVVNTAVDQLAGIVIDAVRLAKLALDNGVGGALEGPSAYLMKSPPKQLPDDQAHDAVERFIKQYARPKARAKAKS